jgi:DNA-binding response OmpR family regulator
MTTPLILIVDDQPDIREMIELTLAAAGYRVVSCGDGREALDHLPTQPVSLILADIAMPEVNGYQLYEAVCANAAWAGIPFLFLTARSLPSDIRYGKRLGVDDYLAKPVQPEDLLAAVAGGLRRAERHRRVVASAGSPPAAPARRDPVLTCGALRIDTAQHRVWMAGAPIELSAKEFALLTQLGRNPGDVVTVADLLQATHGFAASDEEAGNLLRPLVRTVRRKLGYGVGELGCIESVRGVGYRLVSPAPPVNGLPPSHEAQTR